MDRAKELCRVMARYATETGLIPEQVWDADEVPKRHLYHGQPHRVRHSSDISRGRRDDHLLAAAGLTRDQQDPAGEEILIR